MSGNATYRYDRPSSRVVQCGNWLASEFHRQFNLGTVVFTTSVATWLIMYSIAACSFIYPPTHSATVRHHVHFDPSRMLLYCPAGLPPSFTATVIQGALSPECGLWTMRQSVIAEPQNANHYFYGWRRLCDARGLAPGMVSHTISY